MKMADLLIVSDDTNFTRQRWNKLMMNWSRYIRLCPLQIHQTALIKTVILTFNRPPSTCQRASQRPSRLVRSSASCRHISATCGEHNVSCDIFTCVAGLHIGARCHKFVSLPVWVVLMRHLERRVFVSRPWCVLASRRADRQDDDEGFVFQSEKAKRPFNLRTLDLNQTFRTYERFFSLWWSYRMNKTTPQRISYSCSVKNYCCFTL